MLASTTLQEAPPRDMSEMVRIGLEASRVATEKMLDYYQRMGIKVTPEMTLAPEKPKRDAPEVTILPHGALRSAMSLQVPGPAEPTARTRK
jgi:hypothetical protein